MEIPPLKNLYAFEAVVRNGSYKAAAEELCVSRSAISHQIRHLEDLLKVKVFYREKQGVWLTKAGRGLWTDLGESFDIIRRSLANIEKLTSEDLLSVALPPQFAAKWLVPKLPSLRKLHPNIELHLSYPVEMANFHDPSVHVAIKWLHERQVKSDVSLLLDGTLVPTCSPALLENEVDCLNPEILESATLLHEQSDRYWHKWLEKADMHDVTPKRNEFFDDSNVLYQAAINGQGFALLCPGLIEDDLKKGRLVCLFDVRLDSYGYYISVAQGCRDHTNVKRLIGWLQSFGEPRAYRS